MRSDMRVMRLEVVRRLVCGEITINPGETVDAAKVDPMTYAVYLFNGWWAVDAGYFEAEDSPRLYRCEKCGEEIDGGCIDCAEKTDAL